MGRSGKVFGASYLGRNALWRMWYAEQRAKNGGSKSPRSGVFFRVVGRKTDKTHRGDMFFTGPKKHRPPVREHGPGQKSPFFGGPPGRRVGPEPFLYTVILV